MKRIAFTIIIMLVAVSISPCLQLAGTSIATEPHQHEVGRMPLIGPSNSAIDFTLTSQDGRSVSLKDFNGKVVLINFIYTNCKETCPTLIHKFLEVQDAFKTRLGKDIILLSITIDPERDTPPALKRYAKTIGSKEIGWFFLTGKPSEVDKVLKDYGVYYEKGPQGQIGHVNLIILIDKKGGRKNFGGFSYPKEVLLSAINEALR